MAAAGLSTVSLPSTPTEQFQGVIDVDGGRAAGGVFQEFDEAAGLGADAVGLELHGVQQADFRIGGEHFLDADGRRSGPFEGHLAFFSGIAARPQCSSPRACSRLYLLGERD